MHAKSKVHARVHTCACSQTIAQLGHTLAKAATTGEAGMWLFLVCEHTYACTNLHKYLPRSILKHLQAELGRVQAGQRMSLLGAVQANAAMASLLTSYHVQTGTHLSACVRMLMHACL